MKRFLLVCILLAGTCTPYFIQQAAAQITAPTPTTATAFTAKINQLDSYIGAGDMTDAQATWTEVHNMMLNVLAVTKYSIYTATTPTDKTTYEGIMHNQTTIYYQIWPLKTDLATNRVALHTKLISFGATIY